MYSIYALVVDGRVRYIGQTKDVQKRYKQHVSPKRASGWVQELLDKGAKPELRIVESDISDREIAREREKHWIRYYEGQGHALENLVSNYYAHRERREEQEHYEGLYNFFSETLSHQKTLQMIEMTLRGEKLLGHCAWGDTYETIKQTLKLLTELYGINHELDEIEVAKLTFRLFGYVWNKE